MHAFANLVLKFFNNQIFTLIEIWWLYVWKSNAYIHWMFNCSNWTSFL